MVSVPSKSLCRSSSFQVVIYFETGNLDSDGFQPRISVHVLHTSPGSPHPASAEERSRTAPGSPTGGPDDREQSDEHSRVRTAALHRPPPIPGGERRVPQDRHLPRCLPQLYHVEEDRQSGARRSDQADPHGQGPRDQPDRHGKGGHDPPGHREQDDVRGGARRRGGATGPD